MFSAKILAAAAVLFAQAANAHLTCWHPAMYGFNVLMETFPYDNRPLTPLKNMNWDQFWMHGHIGYPPAAGQFLEIPAGGTLTMECTCNKGATSFFDANSGGDQRQGDSACPGEPTTRFHANNQADVAGAALAIAYKSDITQVQPNDLVVFTVNTGAPWVRFTDFQIPTDMPPCPDEGCICTFNWIHRPDSGAEEMFQNAYRCKITGSKSTKTLASPKVAYKCGGQGCQSGAKTPFIWMQNERNNIVADVYDPPMYNEQWGFFNGAQNDIFAEGSSSPATSSHPAAATTTSTPAAASSSVAAGAPQQGGDASAKPTSVAQQGTTPPAAQGTPAGQGATSAAPQATTTPAGQSSATSTALQGTTTRKCKPRPKKTSRSEGAPAVAAEQVASPAHKRAERAHHRNLNRLIRDTTIH